MILKYLMHTFLCYGDHCEMMVVIIGKTAAAAAAAAAAVADLVGG